ncbi:MAG: 6-phosphogluconolactonase [Proteobacteria bacterium]|nr:6-phosphogluconolactonase [Pseudomonadota bacterium]MBU1710496.1 6-phosphogluconolactonase [Pseudomonadota bacterium]
MKFHYFADLEESSKALAAMIVRDNEKAIREKDFHTLVLTGGNTPRLLYTLLGSEPFSKKINWQKTFLFCGDERFVPYDHQESNYGMIHETLLANISIPAHNIYPIPALENSPENTALMYETILKEFFHKKMGPTVSIDNFPVFDTLLFGMGDDGHIASLFPGTPALEETKAWVTHVLPPDYVRPALPRITLTLPVINHGQAVYFHISGKKKLGIAQAIKDNPEAAAKKYPAARVRDAKSISWLIVQ